MLVTDTITYHGDGVRMLGYFAVDTARSGMRPAVLVAPEASGLDDVNRERCRLLAELGYAAFGIDYHGEGEVLRDREEMTRRLQVFMADPLRTRARATAALSALLSHPRVDGARVAALGYCFGGTVALELARSGADIKAAIGFHAGLGTARPNDAAQIRAKILICNGVADPIVPLDQRTAFEREMEAGKVDWQLHLYGGTGHAFSRPGSEALGISGFAYNPDAHRRAWQAMRNLLTETLGADP